MQELVPRIIEEHCQNSNRRGRHQHCRSHHQSQRHLLRRTEKKVGVTNLKLKSEGDSKVKQSNVGASDELTFRRQMVSLHLCGTTQEEQWDCNEGRYTADYIGLIAYRASADQSTSTSWRTSTWRSRPDIEISDRPQPVATHCKRD